MRCWRQNVFISFQIKPAFMDFFFFLPLGGSTASCKHTTGISMTSMLPNNISEDSCLFTHPSDTGQHWQSFYSSEQCVYHFFLSKQCFPWSTGQTLLKVLCCIPPHELCHYSPFKACDSDPTVKSLDSLVLCRELMMQDDICQSV